MNKMYSSKHNIHIRSSFAEEVTCQGSDTMKYMVSKSFLEGFTRALDLSGTKEWPDISEDRKKDYLALRSDWEDIGNSIKRECRNYETSKR